MVVKNSEAQAISQTNYIKISENETLASVFFKLPSDSNMQSGLRSTALQVPCPIKKPVVTWGYRVLEMWLLHMEMCCQVLDAHQISKT